MPDLPHGPPPLDYGLSPEERGAQLERYSREVEREQFWDTCRTLLTCAAWSVASAIGMGLSFALLSAYRRSLERTGEW